MRFQNSRTATFFLEHHVSTTSPPNNMWFPSNTYAQDFNEEYRGKRRKSKRSPKKRSKSRSKSRSKGKKRSHRRR